MIRFRQKNFIAWMPLLMGGSLVQGGIQMKESAKQAEEAEKQAEETQAALDRQTKALNKIAKEAKENPELAQRVIQQKQMSRVKLFATIPPNITGFAKDMWKTQKGNIRKGGKIGLTFGAMGYAGNRLTTSLKDHDEGNDNKNVGFLKKAALTGAGLGSAYLLAKKGKLGNTPIQALGGKTGSQAIQSGMEKVGRAINPIQRKGGKIDKLGTGLNVGFIGMPLLGYMGQRQQIKDQAEQTERAYSENDKKGNRLTKLGAGLLGTAGTFMLAKRGMLGGKAQRLTGNLMANTGGILRSAGIKGAGNNLAVKGSQTYAQGMAKKGATDLGKIEAEKFKQVTAPARVSSGVNKAASFVGFYGKGGTQAVQNTANALAGSKNSEISRRLGKYMQNHKTAANLMAGGGSIAVGLPLMSAAGKPFKAFDKEAYEYEEQQNKKID